MELSEYRFRASNGYFWATFSVFTEGDWVTARELAKEAMASEKWQARLREEAQEMEWDSVRDYVLQNFPFKVLDADIENVPVIPERLIYKNLDGYVELYDFGIETEV